MTAVIEAVNAGQVDASVEVVISNKSDAKGLITASEYGIPTQAILPNTFDSPQAYESTIVDTLTDYEVDLVVLAGYMKIVGDTLLNAYPKRMLNIHPSLLPAFKGLHAQKQAFEYGVKFAGCTAHYVIPELDSGPIIEQAVVPVLDTDTADTLSDKILKEEHRIYPIAIQKVIQQL